MAPEGNGDFLLKKKRDFKIRIKAPQHVDVLQVSG